MKKEKTIALFCGKKVRRTWQDDKWWFVVEDVVNVLIDSKNPKQYVKKMRQRDVELNKGWVQIVPTLEIQTQGGMQKMNCANTEGILRIIQSIPSKKAEPFKKWLAKVGRERIEEIENPELAMERMRLTYSKKGYSKDWIDKRMRGIAVRLDLTDEWRSRGLKRPIEYAILTNEIMDEAFNMTVKEYKNFKGLDKENLRDHMTDLETILTMLGEATSTKLSQDRDSQGFPELKKDAQDGGKVAGNTRKNIEKLSDKKIISKENYLNLHQKNKLT